MLPPQFPWEGVEQLPRVFLETFEIALGGTLLAVLGAVQARQSAPRGAGQVVASAVEHSAVLNAADWLHRVTGAAVSITGVDGLGRADSAEFAAAARNGPGIYSSRGPAGAGGPARHGGHPDQADVAGWDG